MSLLYTRRPFKRTIEINAVRKGLWGGSWMWRAVWALLALRNSWMKVAKSSKAAPIVFTEPLREGEAWAIVHVPEDSKRGRGQGRRLGIGPRRVPPRATALAAPALASIGKRILAAPSADRINEILGEDVVSDPEPSRSQLRYEARTERRQLKAAKKASKKAAKRAERSALPSMDVDGGEASELVEGSGG